MRSQPPRADRSILTDNARRPAAAEVRAERRLSGDMSRCSTRPTPYTYAGVRLHGQTVGPATGGSLDSGGNLASTHAADSACDRADERQSALGAASVADQPLLPTGTHGRLVTYTRGVSSALAPVIVVVVVCFALVLFQRNLSKGFDYQCGDCGHRFSPSPWAAALAPHRFGGLPLNHSYAALRWLVEHAAELGIRPDLITIGGGSSGANLAAAITLKIRNQGGPTLALQLLEVPPLDLTLSSPSIYTLGPHYFPATGEYRKVIGYYLNTPDEASNPYVSPLLAPDLSGLPPAHIMSAEYDPLRDDAARYARRLNDAGVATTYSLQRGHLHISGLLTKAFPPARAWRAEVLDVLRRSTAQPPSHTTTRTAANPVPSGKP